MNLQKSPLPTGYNPTPTLATSSFHETLRSEVFRTVPELFPSGNTSEQTCSPFSSEHFGDTSEHFGRPSRNEALRRPAQDTRVQRGRTPSAAATSQVRRPCILYQSDRRPTASAHLSFWAGLLPHPAPEPCRHRIQAQNRPHATHHALNLGAARRFALSSSLRQVHSLTAARCVAADRSLLSNRATLRWLVLP